MNSVTSSQVQPDEPRRAPSPHAHDRSAVERIMWSVCAALAPATLWGCYLFGWPAVWLFLITCASAIATEMGCLWLQGRRWQQGLDGSALLTGWLLAMTLPPWAPWWIGSAGAFFAIAVGKHVYGGLGQNLFNPAMLARVGLLISFPVHMTTWPNPMPISAADAPGLLDSFAITAGSFSIPDGWTGATVLGQLKVDGAAAVAANLANESAWTSGSVWSSWLGWSRGSLGETSALLILLGGLWLLYQRLITWHIPVALLATVILGSSLLHSINPAIHAGPLLHISSGGLMLGAFFIATDYVTSPSSPSARLVFGAGCGALILLIRSWGSFPEAVGFAVLIMNALTPLLDRVLKPRIYGRDRRGNPLTPATPARKQIGS